MHRLSAIVDPQGKPRCLPVGSCATRITTPAAEFGFRVGLRLYRAHDEARKEQIGGTQGAMLGLLALLLGFTFAMAVGRYETRRTLVLTEANAIGTTCLRASFLPMPGAVWLLVLAVSAS